MNPKPQKQVCDYCGDSIVSKPHWIERFHRKVKGYNTYHYFAVDEGCYLLLEARGLLDDVFGEDGGDQ